jgi:hypothetical protein
VTPAGPGPGTHFTGPSKRKMCGAFTRLSRVPTP